MDRRSFLRSSALGGSAAAATLAAPAYAQGNRTLTLVTTWGRGLAGVHDSAQYCARRDHGDDRRPGHDRPEGRRRARRGVRGVRRGVVGAGRHVPRGRLLLPRQRPLAVVLLADPVRHDVPGVQQLVLPRRRPRARRRALLDLRAQDLPGGQHRAAVGRLVRQADQRRRGLPGPQVPDAGAGRPGAGQARRVGAEPAPAPRSTRRCPRARSTGRSGSGPGPTRRPASRRSRRSTTPPASTSPDRT